MPRKKRRSKLTLVKDTDSGKLIDRESQTSSAYLDEDYSGEIGLRPQRNYAEEIGLRPQIPQRQMVVNKALLPLGFLVTTGVLHGSGHNKKRTTIKIKDTMPSLHKLDIFPSPPSDDDIVCKQKLKSFSSVCIFDTVEYLNCDGLTSHRYTDASQTRSCSTNIQHLFFKEYFVDHLKETVNSYYNIFKEMIMDNKDEKMALRCFGYQLRFQLYNEIRQSPLVTEFSYSYRYYKDTLKILYSMPHIFSLPLYELFRRGWHLNNRVSDFPVPEEAMDITLQGIKRHLLQREHHCVYITKLLFCQYETTSSPVYLLVYYRGKKSGRTREVNGIEVKWKPDAFVNNEAHLIMKLRPAFGSEFSSSYLPRVTTEVASQLFKRHSNLSMIASSEFKSTGYQTNNHTIKNVVCFQLFCKSKGYIPLGEPIFPPKIDSFDVDVLEGICYFGNGCVQMGTQIGAEGQRKTGAVGGFVDLPSNKTGLITCAHNIYFPNNLINKDFSTNLKVYTENVLDPSGFEESGHVLRSVFRHGDHKQVSVDAALVEINRPISASFPDVPTIQLRKAGFDPQNPPHFDSGEIVKTIPDRNQRVIKYGPVSELTCGTLSLDGLHVRMEKEEMAFPLPNAAEKDLLSVIMYGQYGVNNTNEGFFFKAGDSGSFVFVVEEDSSHRQTLKCVGMAIGIAKGPGTCIITPIKDVLETLELDLMLKKFNYQIDNNVNQSTNSKSLTTDEMFRILISRTQSLESKLDAGLKRSEDTELKSRDEMKNFKIEIRNEMKKFQVEINDNLNVIKEEVRGKKSGNTSRQGHQKRKDND